MVLHWCGSLALLVGLSAAAVPRPAPLPMTLLVHVVDSASRLPLPNAEVSSPRLRRLTDADGNVRFTWPAGGAISIRVRQLGFRFADRTLHRGTSPTATEDTVVVALVPGAFALPQVVTEADKRCEATQDAAGLALSSSTMQLLRFGAEQYNTFKETYPFGVTLTRRTVRNPAIYGGPRVQEGKEVAESETYGDRYFPGQALLRTREGYYSAIGPREK